MKKKGNLNLFLIYSDAKLVHSLMKQVDVSEVLEVNQNLNGAS
jgi:hypothetical protein